MNSFNTIFFDWQVLLIPILVVIISQCIKIAIEVLQRKGFHLSHINDYGGMPSSHTALFISLTTIVGLIEGFQSPLFAVTFLVAVTFIRDAVGIRFALGHHGKVLNHLLSELPKNIRDSVPETLEERLGHTPLEALAGGLLGFVTTLILFLLVN